MTNLKLVDKKTHRFVQFNDCWSDDETTEGWCIFSKNDWTQLITGCEEKFKREKSIEINFDSQGSMSYASFYDFMSRVKVKLITADERDVVKRLFGETSGGDISFLDAFEYDDED